MRGNPIPDPSSSSDGGGGGGLSGDPHPRLTLNTKGLILEKAKKKKYDARFLFSEFHTKGKTWGPLCLPHSFSFLTFASSGRKVLLGTADFGNSTLRWIVFPFYLGILILTYGPSYYTQMANDFWWISMLQGYGRRRRERLFRARKTEEEQEVDIGKRKGHGLDGGEGTVGERERETIPVASLP